MLVLGLHFHVGWRRGRPGQSPLKLHWEDLFGRAGKPLAREVFAMFESLFSSLDTDSVFDEFRRLENEMVQLFGHSPWPAGIRSAGRGTFPPLNVGATPEPVDVYLFAAKSEPQSPDLSIQQDLTTGFR